MGLFHRQPTTTEKNEIRSLISRAQTCGRNLTDADKISNYFKEWDKLMSLLDRLIYYENRGIKFKPSPRLDLSNAKSKKQRTEKNCIDRAYEDLKVSLFALKTEQGKRNKTVRFFEEMEYYFPRMDSNNVDYVVHLKKETMEQFPGTSFSVNPQIISPSAINFCPECGSRVIPGSNFCSNCGYKLL